MKKKTKYNINSGNSFHFGSRLTEYRRYKKDQHVISKYLLKSISNEVDDVTINNIFEVESSIIKKAQTFVDDGDIGFLRSYCRSHFSDPNPNAVNEVSLNKKKRWLLPGRIQKAVEEFKEAEEEHDNCNTKRKSTTFSMTLIERETFPDKSRFCKSSHKCDCTGYHDSSLKNPHVKPKKSKYSFFTDLRAKEIQKTQPKNKKMVKKMARKQNHNLHFRGIQRKELKNGKAKSNNAQEEQLNRTWFQAHPVRPHLTSQDGLTEVRYEVNHPMQINSHKSHQHGNFEAWNQSRRANHKEEVDPFYGDPTPSFLCSATEYLDSIVNTMIYDYEEEEEVRYTPNVSSSLCLEDFLDTRKMTSHRKNKNKKEKPSVLSMLNKASSETVIRKGKGCAIYVCQFDDTTEVRDEVDIKDDISELSVDSGYMTSSSSLVHQGSQPTVFHAEQKLLEILIREDSLQQSILESEFQGGYTEGGSFPRCFAVNLQKVLAETVTSYESFLVFQETQTVMTLNACDYRKVKVKYEGTVPDLEGVWDHLRGLGRNGVLSLGVRDLVDGLVHFVRQSQKMVDKSLPQRILNCRVPSLCVFETLFGWSSQSYMPQQAIEHLQHSETHQHFYVPWHPESTQGEFCDICYCELGMEENVLALARCQHWFCAECWRGHLVARIRCGDSSLTCPGFKCQEVIPSATLLWLLPYSFYKRWLEHKYGRQLEMSPQWKWCPRSRCGAVVWSIVTKQGLPQSVQCACGATWCFECQEEPHWPTSCQQAQTYKKMLKQKGDEGLKEAKGKIFFVPTKKCPMCRYPIEKNGGCPHMVCAMCKHQFCWECGQPWASHTSAICSRGRIDERVIEIDSTFDVNLKEEFYKQAVRHRHRRLQLLIQFKNPLKFEDMCQKFYLKCSWSPFISTLNVSDVASVAAQAVIQIHLVLEHCNVLLMWCSHKHREKALKMEIAKLKFVTERIDQIICTNRRNELKKSVSRLAKYMDIVWNNMQAIQRLARITHLKTQKCAYDE